LFDKKFHQRVLHYHSNPLTPAAYITLLLNSLKHLISRNARLDRAREPVKTPLDPRDNKESNENNKNIPLHLKFFRKIFICAVAVLIFWQNFEKIQKHVPASRLALPIRFLSFADRRNTQKQDPFKQVGSGRFGREIRGSKSVGQES